MVELFPLLLWPGDRHGSGVYEVSKELEEIACLLGPFYAVETGLDVFAIETEDDICRQDAVANDA